MTRRERAMGRLREARRRIRPCLQAGQDEAGNAEGTGTAAIGFKFQAEGAWCRYRFRLGR
jgi:hypothetical protein